MPKTYIDIQLEVKVPEKPEPTEYVGYAFIKSISLTGEVKFEFPIELELEPGLMDKLNQDFDKIRANKGLYDEPNPYEDLLVVNLIPGVYSDPDKIGTVKRTVTKLDSLSMVVQLEFSNPILISQNDDPESIKITLRFGEFLGQPNAPDLFLEKKLVR
jgi:hypothetical protein